MPVPGRRIFTTSVSCSGVSWGDAQRQRIAAIALVAGGIHLWQYWHTALLFEDFLAEFDQARLSALGAAGLGPIRNKEMRAR